MAFLEQLYPMNELTPPSIPGPQHHIAVFASGTGTNAEKIITYFRGHAQIRVELVVCNKEGAGVIEVARNNQIPLLMVEKKRFEADGYLQELKNRDIDFIVLAGFLWKIPEVLIGAFRNRIINIHPALLPLYGGKGMYGSRVHQAVLSGNEKKSGISIHYVDEHYDNGDLILQVTCPVYPSDTAESLAKRVHELEHIHFAPTIEKLLCTQS